MNILVTGGTGYIGSHTCVELLNAGYTPIIIDNFSNSNNSVVDLIYEITGKKVLLHEADVRDKSSLAKIFKNHEIDSVIHFAGLKAVGESVVKPIEYYDNNVSGTITLCEVMKEFGVKEFVFSSSATVYGDPASLPIKEDFPLSATNPYGRSKLIIEEILEDIFISDSSWKVALLRYFNPVGAHESGLIGEDPNDIPNNLMPYISQVAVGKLEQLSVFGNDYNTPDGTGVRDYIHVVDLAKAHVKAVETNRWIKEGKKGGVLKVNLGTGRGYSVLEMVKAFEKASGKKVAYKIVERRPGDIAACYADCSYASNILSWKAEHDLERMCKDTWRFQTKKF